MLGTGFPLALFLSGFRGLSHVSPAEKTSPYQNPQLREEKTEPEASGEGTP